MKVNNIAFKVVLHLLFVVIICGIVFFSITNKYILVNSNNKYINTEKKYNSALKEIKSLKSNISFLTEELDLLKDSSNDKSEELEKIRKEVEDLKEDENTSEDLKVINSWWEENYSIHNYRTKLSGIIFLNSTKNIKSVKAYIYDNVNTNIFVFPNDFAQETVKYITPYINTNENEIFVVFSYYYLGSTEVMDLYPAKVKLIIEFNNGTTQELFETITWV